MARAMANYVFAPLLAVLAVLAVLSVHGVVPSTRPVTPAVIVCPAGARQQAGREIGTARFNRPARPAPIPYASRIQSRPAIIGLFQRPPPASPLFS